MALPRTGENNRCIFYLFFAAINSPLPFNRSAFPGAETARKEDDQADQQDQAESAAADDRSAQVKPAATEQQEQNHHD
jgi:hypothetical protein